MKRKREDTELHDYVRRESLATANDLGADLYPSIHSLSAAFFYTALPVPMRPEKPELVYFNYSKRFPPEISVGISNWNSTWETAQFRNEVQYDDVKYPPGLEFLKEKEKHIYLVPLTKIRYHDYAPLYHLLPAGLLQQHGIPLLKRGRWPYNMSLGEETVLPQDFYKRLSRAFSEFIWPLLETRSPLYAFSERDPVKILSHNLDHWLPYIYQVAEERARAKPLTQPQKSFFKIHKASKKEAEANDALVRPPLCGGDLWTGEEEALEAAKRMVELSDDGGKLRSLLDAVQSHRAEDDFSDKWSTQKVDFERHFHKTRVKVNFVELKGAAPVHGPWSELHEDRLWSELAAIIELKDRRIIVLLREGITEVGKISEELGYANHSPISKALARIRKKAFDVLG